MDRDEKRDEMKDDRDNDRVDIDETNAEDRERGREPIKDRSPAVDPYTGEPIPPEEIPNYPISESSFTDEVEDVPLEVDDAMDFLSIERGVNDEAVMDDIDDFTDDPEILEDFSERQELTGGSSELYESLVNYTGRSPDQTAEDIDAEWDMIDVSGDEGVGATNPTPDQDIVEELGEAWGVTYEDDEELDTYGKLNQRDENRFELDPRSADEEDDEDEGEAGDIPDPQDQEF